MLTRRQFIKLSAAGGAAARAVPDTGPGRGPEGVVPPEGEVVTQQTPLVPEGGAGVPPDQRPHRRLGVLPSAPRLDRPPHFLIALKVRRSHWRMSLA